MCFRFYTTKTEFVLHSISVSMNDHLSTINLSQMPILLLICNVRMPIGLGLTITID